MLTSQITFRAIAPIYSPLSLHLGVDQFSTHFTEEFKALYLQIFNSSDDDEKTTINWKGNLVNLSEQHGRRQYQSTDENSKDVRLMCWTPANNDDGRCNVMFHVFTNNIAIVEVELEMDLNDLKTVNNSIDDRVKAAEEKVQELAKAQIDLHYNDFRNDLQQLSPYLSSDFALSTTTDNNDITWVARTMLINDEQLESDEFRSILTSWLKKTARPDDALKIINNKKQYSMTWLNYVVKNPQAVGLDPHIHMMILAQYYYVSQENCNSALRGAIEVAYSQSRKEKMDAILAKTRINCRLNEIAYFENIKFLNRPNRALLEDILSGWQFDQLVDNSERMIEICNARLQEEDNKKRERSTTMTDFLLVTLSFFAIFELSLYLTEFSREMMSRPALDYNDNKSSFFLGLIAEVDADIMFSFGFGLTLLLIIVYRYIKRN
jgi:hypothetical protein